MDLLNNKNKDVQLFHYMKLEPNISNMYNFKQYTPVLSYFILKTIYFLNMDVFWLSTTPPKNAETLFHLCMKHSNTLFNIITDNMDFLSTKVNTKSSKMTLL